MMKLKRVICSCLILMLLSVGGCAKIFHGMMGNDPDGDGDVKGISHYPLHRQATGRRVFIFDPRFGAWAAYDEKGNRVNMGKASGGADFCKDVGRPCRTISGKFQILSKGGEDCKSSRYPVETNGGGPMPYCMHFSPKGYSIHADTVIPDYNASHGCIRVTPEVAKWLNEKFLKIGSTVLVGPY